MTELKKMLNDLVELYRKAIIEIINLLNSNDEYIKVNNYFHEMKKQLKLENVDHVFILKKSNNIYNLVIKKYYLDIEWFDKKETIIKMKIFDYFNKVTTNV